MRPLTARQRQIAVLYAEGFSGPQVGESLGLKPSSVYQVVKQAREKYRAAGIDVSTKLKLRARFVTEGLIHE